MAEKTTPYNKEDDPYGLYYIPPKIKKQGHGAVEGYRKKQRRQLSKTQIKKRKCKKRKQEAEKAFRTPKGLPASFSYKRYIRSKVWFALRKKVLKRKGSKCVTCEELALEVHHWWYPDTWGLEPMRSLDPLCWDCHQMIHADFKDDLYIIQHEPKERDTRIGYIKDVVLDIRANEQVDEEYMERFG